MTAADAQTLEAYNAMPPDPRWGKVSAAFRSWIHELPTSCLCLDVGCGNGEAVLEMLDCGLNAIGIDASDTMVNASRTALSDQGRDPERIHSAALPGPLPFTEQSFQAISCCAVLMHLPELRLFDTLQELTRLLRVGGTLFLSIPTNRPDVDPTSHRDTHGRLFTPLQTHQLSLLCERMGYRLDAVTEEADSLGREGITWSNLHLTRLDENINCPLNRIEQILNHDRKDATYKLALVRALAEIAQTEFHVASFLPVGKVSIPLGKIADRWLWYYWPIFAHERFVPQKNGEREAGGQNLAIRRTVEALIEQAGPGGLSAFHADWRRGRMGKELQQAWNAAHAKLKNTIWNMPVRHAGDGEEFSVFQYNRQTKSVEMDAALWREFCLTGSWIQDATVLRWAELTEQLSRQQIKASEALDCLLTRWDPMRDVNDARKYFLKHQADLRCVWSDKKIGRRGFEVDHTLPYALWKNNDLWNLLPALPAVNHQKRDHIPSTPLLRSRRDGIIETWQGLCQEFEGRFLRDAQTLMGRESIQTNNWEASLFSRLTEACEITATQRGVKRWQPEDFEEAAIPDPVTVPKHAPYGMKPSPPLYVTENQGLTPAEPPDDPPERIPFQNALPLVGSLAAGDPFQGFHADRLDDLEVFEWIDVPESVCRPNRFVVEVAGDSMEPVLAQGSYAVFEYHRRPSGDRKIVIAHLPEFGITSDASDTGTIKYLSQTPTHWVFEPANPAYDPIQVSKIDCPQHPILGEFVTCL